MKKYIYTAVLFVVLFSCKKQSEQLVPQPPSPIVPPGYITNVNAYLKSNLTGNDYTTLDFGNIVLSAQQDGWFLKVGLRNKKITTDFVLLQTDSFGNCSNGKFIHIKRDSSDLTVFNGSITVESLHRVTAKRQIIANSAMQLECEGGQDVEELSEDGGCDVIPACDNCLPEVVVVGYLPSGGGGGGGTTYSDYLNLSALVNGSSYSSGTSNGNTGTTSGVYSPVVGGGNPGGASNPVRVSPNITITYDQTSTKPGIDVSAFMKCFSTIPDAGAECSVTILDDLPVNDNPSYIFNILSGATGHTFLQLTKTNGTQSVTQIIGFTTSKPLAVLGLPVAGKIVDNTGHKYNASLTMNITPAQLTTEIQTINTLGSNQKYDIWEYNCVNYAVNILNAVRPGNPLQVIQLNDVTSGDSYSTPQGLYLTLDQMKQANGPEAKNITVDVVKNAGTSHGACTP